MKVLSVKFKSLLHQNVKISYEFSPRRDGDLSAFWANSTKARDVLSWKPEKSLQDMMQDTWRWQSNNPNGYNN